MPFAESVLGQVDMADTKKKQCLVCSLPPLLLELGTEPLDKIVQKEGTRSGITMDGGFLEILLYAGGRLQYLRDFAADLEPFMLSLRVW